jgi:tetratricopeptide (TPR) repeat protein
MCFPDRLAPGLRLSITIVAVFCSQLLSAEASGRTVTLDDANRVYAAGDFRMSLMYCNLILAKHPSPMAHYCRANALVKLSEFSEAKKEYAKAIELSSDERLRHCCEAALATFAIADGTSLSHYQRANALARIGDGEGAKAEYEWSLRSTKDPLLQKYCRMGLAVSECSKREDDPAAQIMNADNSPTTVPNVNAEKSAVAQRISSQVDKLNQLIVNNNKFISDSNTRVAHQIAEQMRWKAEADATAMTSTGGRQPSMMVSRQLEEVRLQGRESANRYESQTRRSAEEAEQLVQRRTDALNTSAEALQVQLASKSTGGVHLIERGTDLFIRNYALDQTVNPAHAYIGDAASQDKGKFIVPLEATPGSLDNVLYIGSVRNGRRASRADVFGKLLSPLQRSN